MPPAAAPSQAREPSMSNDTRRLTTRWSRPGQPSVWFQRDTSLGLAGRLISRPLGGLGSSQGFPVRQTVFATKALVSILMCGTVASCQAALTSSPLSTVADSTPLAAQPSQAPTLALLAIHSPSPEECDGQVFTGGPGESPLDPGAQTGVPLSSAEVAGYLNIMGIHSLCVPVPFGAPSLNVDWNDLGDPPNATGRMISIGFDGLQDAAGGWGRGFIVYSTYDFEGGSEYSVFATQEDLRQVQAGEMPHLVTSDGIDGFVRFFPGMAMHTQPIQLTYVFPFPTHFVAVAFTIGTYDSSEVEAAIGSLEAGSHPDLANPEIPLLIELVSSIRFE